MRQGSTPTDEDMALLAALWDRADEAMGKVQVALREVLGIESTGRLKSPNSIAYKLARHPTMRLAQMQDVGGVRVERFPASLRQQTALEAKVRRMLDDVINMLEEVSS